MGEGNGTDFPRRVFSLLPFGKLGINEHILAGHFDSCRTGIFNQAWEGFKHGFGARKNNSTDTDGERSPIALLILTNKCVAVRTST